MKKLKKYDKIKKSSQSLMELRGDRWRQLWLRHPSRKIYLRYSRRKIAFKFVYLNSQIFKFVYLDLSPLYDISLLKTVNQFQLRRLYIVKVIDKQMDYLDGRKGLSWMAIFFCIGNIVVGFVFRSLSLEGMFLGYNFNSLSRKLWKPCYNLFFLFIVSKIRTIN